MGNPYFTTQVAELEFFGDSPATPPPGLLTGTIFGSNNANNVLAFDGDVTTCYNNYANNGYVGMDLGAGVSKSLTKVRWHPFNVDGQSWYMNYAQGKIQGSNDGVNYYDVGIDIGNSLSNIWYEQTLTGSPSYRYFRWFGVPYFTSCLAELEFYGESVATPTPTLVSTPTPTPTPTPTATPTPTPVPPVVGLMTGTVFGSEDAAMNAKAFDGDINTVFNPGKNFGMVGIDLGIGISKKLTKLRWYPHIVAGQSWLADRCQGFVEGSNDGVNYTNIFTIPSGGTTWVEQSISDTNTYRYFRFIGTQYFNTEISEIQFYSEEVSPTPTPCAFSVTLGCLSAADLTNTGDTIYDGYMNTNGKTTVTIRNSYLAGVTIPSTTIDPSTKTATFTGLSNGRYLVSVSRNGYLIRDIPITVAGSNVNLGNKSLLAGDVYVDGIVDGSDSESLFSAIGFSYGSSRYVPAYDLNLDGIIDGSDTEILFTNLGLDVSIYGENVDYYN